MSERGLALFDSLKIAKATRKKVFFLFLFIFCVCFCFL